MAYNEQTIKRIRELLFNKGVSFTEKNMFGGVCFLVDEKMLCGNHLDKNTGEDLLMCRIGETVYENALEQNYCIPMEFTGRTMKGYVYILQDGFKINSELDYWLQLCLDFNPLAKKSKKKSK